MSTLNVNSIQTAGGISPVLVTDIAKKSELAASGGSAMVGYMPDGIGAVATTVQAVLLNSIPVNVAQFSGNASAAFQAAINEAKGRAIIVPEGDYTFLMPLTYNTTGLGHVEGLKLIGAGKRKVTFNNNTGGVLLTITGGDANTDFQYNGELSGFTIKNPLGTGTKGVLIDSSFKSRIDIKVQNQTAHGIHLLSTIGDATDCSQVNMLGCETAYNGGDGIRIEGTDGAIQSMIWADGGRHIGNTGMGIRMLSAINCTANKNAIAYNLAGGIDVSAVGGGAYSKLINVEDNEFDSNAGIALNFGTAVGCKEARNYYICNNGAPTVTKLVNIAANSLNIVSEQALPRMPVGYTGVTAFTIAAGAQNAQIIDPGYSSWQTSGNTKYTDAGTKTMILESNTLLTPMHGGIELNGGGVVFPAIQVASANVNTLDDYEEGTWTPVDSSGAGLALASASGVYTKVGRLVTIHGTWAFPVTANTNNISIGGLPFVAGTNNAGALLSETVGDMALIPNGTPLIFIYGGNFVRRTNANYSSANVYFNASYIV